MDRFTIKKRKLDDNESSVAGTSSGSITHRTVSVIPKTVVRQYNEDYYLSFGFISSGEEQPRPKCVLCDVNLANQAMVPSELKTPSHKALTFMRETKVTF
jgi:hypothetical protein